jgi:3-deoxy-manno-octulosonate cytidylyltransferase (CMP-KDO synthetase)
MNFRIIIPARLNSSRLPGKALLDINGKPMIQHVFERGVESGAEMVVVATDSDEIAKACEAFGASVVMTSSDHPTGTDRIGEAVLALGWDDSEIIVNLQSDEPMIDPKLIRQVAHDLFTRDNVKMATACQPITDVSDIFNPNVVKVVLNKRGCAMYFSRAPIPYDRQQFQDWQNGKDVSQNGSFYKHLGLYAYRVGFLSQYLQWDDCPQESIEMLEQLRVLWYGGKIFVSCVKQQAHVGVDTEEDLEMVRDKLSKVQSPAVGW